MATGKEIAVQVREELSNTEFACSSLEPLTGGTANFIFKGVLEKPLSDGTGVVAIKHGEGYSATHPDFQLTTTRCLLEEECLKAVSSLPPTANPACIVRTPKLWYFNRDSNTQVQEYLPDALSLKDYALHHFPATGDASLKPHCLALGQGLGTWLRNFHIWAKRPEQSALQQTMRSDRAMQTLKYDVNYGRLESFVAKYPSILLDAKEVFEQVKRKTEEELRDGSQHQIIHGDFWTGNVLLPNRPLGDGAQTPMFVVDWELSQLGVRPLDLGQMIAELYELFFFKGIHAGRWLIEGFAAGYGYVDDDFAFRTAITVGTHLICWGSTVPGWGSDGQVEDVVRVGKDLILKAWHKDRSWFEASDLACLFDNP